MLILGLHWKKKCRLQLVWGKKRFCEKTSVEMQTSWLEPRATNAKDVGLIPVWAICLRAALHDPYESLPAQNILWLLFCDCLKSKCFQKLLLL